MADACCAPPTDPVEDGAAGWSEQWRLVAAVVATTAWAVGVAAGWADAGALSPGAFVVAVVSGGATFVPSSLIDLRHGRVGVGLLMTIAGAGALVLGELPEAAALAFLFSISEALESWAVTRARRELRAVLSIVPDTALVRRGSEIVEVPTDEVASGDILVLRAGARLVTDAVVTEGRSVLDVSAVTGESLPVECGPGDAVIAGSINGGGHLELTATTPASDSTLARIVHAVEEAQDRKGHAQRIADRIARPLVPVILVVAATVAGLGALAGDPALWAERALVVLVAAAPCALAISVPVTTFAAIGAATRTGVLIKGGAALEALATVRVVAFDKTGTLTRNQPRVVDVAAHGLDRRLVLELASALEAHSDHPLATAITAEHEPTRAAAQVQTVAGAGVTGNVDGHVVRLGNPRFVDPGPFAADVDRMTAAGASVVVVERDGTPVGAVAVRDDLRPEATDTVAALARLDLATVILTGDHTRTARAIADQVGIDDVRAELLPADKADAVADLRRRGPVLMIGDGINDAPALASADVGVAMGALGSDVAIEAADVAIMGDHLTHLPDLLIHARRSRRIMVQNLAMSGLLIATLIPLAGVGLLGLGVVVAIHEGAEVLVIANGLRARATSATSPDTMPVPELEEHVHV
ncbi:MAG: cation-translocating P-type ATPase [Acidimicrobiales bacterium]|nr:cation-translocating P-type ATPase [Acidimicrobiales bacterium]